jgi:transcriptional regulator with XRE-family HTH domain
MSESREHGEQPIGALMEAWSLGVHDMVDASPEQLTHKQVQRARKGRTLTLAMMQKMTRSLNIAVWYRLKTEERKVFFEYLHKHLWVGILQTVIRCSRPHSKGYPSEFKHVGNCLRARRLDLGWSQSKAATSLGVTSGTLLGWEHGRREPLLRNWPRIVDFLRDLDRDRAKCFGDVLREWRHRIGLSLKTASKELGISPNEIRRMEASCS